MDGDRGVGERGDGTHLDNTLLRRLGRSDRASLHGSFSGASEKVGRNNPCPRGSEEKHKKRCLERPCSQATHAGGLRLDRRVPLLPRWR